MVPGALGNRRRRRTLGALPLSYPGTGEVARGRNRTCNHPLMMRSIRFLHRESGSSILARPWQEVLLSQPAFSTPVAGRWGTEGIRTPADCLPAHYHRPPVGLEHWVPPGPSSEPAGRSKGTRQTLTRQSLFYQVRHSVPRCPCRSRATIPRTPFPRCRENGMTGPIAGNRSVWSRGGSNP